MPESADEIRRQMGLSEESIAAENLDSLQEWGGLPPGIQLGEPQPIFPRIQLEKEEKPKMTTDKSKEITIDARPSDALALSLRFEVPIFAAEDVLTKSMLIDVQNEPEDTSDEGKKWQEILEKMDPEDFGNS